MSNKEIVIKPSTSLVMREIKSKPSTALVERGLVDLSVAGDNADLREESGTKYEEITYKNGKVYYGQVKDGKWHGQGTYTWAGEFVGQVYEGDWRDDKMHGQGKLTAADGSVKTGLWQAGIYRGKSS